MVMMGRRHRAVAAVLDYQPLLCLLIRYGILLDGSKRAGAES